MRIDDEEKAIKPQNTRRTDTSDYQARDLVQLMGDKCTHQYGVVWSISGDGQKFFVNVPSCPVGDAAGPQSENLDGFSPMSAR